MATLEVASHYLDEVRRQFRGHKRLAEGAMAQLTDQDVFLALDLESNSVAVVVKHMAGNMRSRFTDFLTSDGEKPDRHRDQEFEMAPGVTRADVMRRWDEGWAQVLGAIDALRPEDLTAVVTIRGEPPQRAAVAEPASGALRVSRRADCVFGQALALQGVEVAQHSARKIGRNQSAAGGAEGGAATLVPSVHP
jgi:hypothetical protein